MQYLFLILANTIVCKYNKFNLGTVNATQQKFAWLEDMDNQIKTSLLLTLLQ